MALIMFKLDEEETPDISFEQWYKDYSEFCKKNQKLDAERIRKRREDKLVVDDKKTIDYYRGI